MKTKLILVLTARLGCAAIAIVVLSGCVTPALWSKKNREGEFTPARNPRLELFQSSSNLLVVFDQTVKGSSWRARRAYYLGTEDCCGKPRFVNPSQARNLRPVPVLVQEAPWVPSVEPEGYCAVQNPNEKSFLLYEDGNFLTAYALPNYRATKDKTARILFTPLAVTVDAAILGAAVGAVVIFSPVLSGLDEPLVKN